MTCFWYLLPSSLNNLSSNGISLRRLYDLIGTVYSRMLVQNCVTGRRTASQNLRRATPSTGWYQHHPAHRPPTQSGGLVTEYFRQRVVPVARLGFRTLQPFGGDRPNKQRDAQCAEEETWPVRSFSFVCYHVTRGSSWLSFFPLPAKSTNFFSSLESTS